MLPNKLSKAADQYEEVGKIKLAAHTRQMALVFGIYTATCPVRGKELYELKKSEMIVTRELLSLQFVDFKNEFFQGTKWKLLSRKEGFGFLIDLALRVQATEYRREICTHKDSEHSYVFMTISGLPYTSSTWSTSVKETVAQHCKNLHGWNVGVNIIRKAFVTRFLGSSPSNSLLDSVACAMNTSVEQLYKSYDERCSCERSAEGISKALEIYNQPD